MYLTTFLICVLKYTKYIQQDFFSAPGLPWQVALKTTKVKIDLLADIDMLLMVEKYIRGGICHTIHRYVKANNI